MLPPWVAQYIGIPFVERGRDPATGLDCWGLAKIVLERHFGVHELPDFADRYIRTREPMVAEIFSEQMQATAWHRVERPAAGDVAVLRILGKPRHVGVMITRNLMLSTERRTGSLIEHLDDPRWTGKLEGYYRHA